MSRKLKWHAGCPGGFVSALYHPEGEYVSNLPAVTLQILLSCHFGEVCTVEGTKRQAHKPGGIGCTTRGRYMGHCCVHNGMNVETTITLQGQWVVTASADHTASLFNFLKQMKRERLIERFESPIYSAAISQSGDILALAG